MENAVIYARYSSQGQNEQSIDGQVRTNREFAANKQLNIIDIYIDKAKTGTNDKRHDFQRMIDDAKSGKFKYVIVYMFDRFTRNRLDSIMYKEILKKYGVRVISALEPVSDDEGGEFYEMFLEWNAEQYSKRLSKRVRDGITTSIDVGTHIGGHLIYGYKLVPIAVNKKVKKKIIIDEESARIIKYAFERYASSISKTEIAKELNAKGLRIYGKPFTKRTFDKILCNEKYTGSFTCGGRLCENMYPKIIDRKTFDMVQKRLEKNKLQSGANSAKAPYLLQGKLYCGHCGSNMIADAGTSKLGNLYRYYVCSQRKKHHNCNKATENKDFIEWYVTEQTVNYLSDPNRVDIIASDTIKYFESRTSEAEIKRIITEKTKVQKEIDNAVNLLVSCFENELQETLKSKISQLCQLKKDLESRQFDLELEQGLKVTKADIIKFIKEFTKGDILDKDFQKRIIDNLVSAIYLYDDKVVIYFNIKNGKEIAFIGKNETDDALNEVEDSDSVQSLSPLLYHEQ